MSWFVDSITLPGLYLLFFFFFLVSGAVGPIIAAVSKELFPVSISGTSVGTVNLFPFLGGAVFQVLIGAVLSKGNPGQTTYHAASYRTMFLICLAAALVSLVMGFFLRETLVAVKRS